MQGNQLKLRRNEIMHGILVSGKISDHGAFIWLRNSSRSMAEWDELSFPARRLSCTRKPWSYSSERAILVRIRKNDKRRLYYRRSAQ